MAIVWVLAADKRNSIVGAPLVKAEAITGFKQTHNTVDALGIHPEEPVVVAASFGSTNAPLPDGFHLDLLKTITEQAAAGLPEDHVVVVAEYEFGAPWKWRAYPLSEYEYPKA